MMTHYRSHFEALKDLTRSDWLPGFTPVSPLEPPPSGRTYVPPGPALPRL